MKYSIGSSLKDDRYLVIVPKETYIPLTRTEIVLTTADNQTSSAASIHYGENVKASLNTKFADMIISGLPKKPAGEAKMKYHFTIDIYGNLRMEKFSLDNGVRLVINRRIMGLLEEENR